MGLFLPRTYVARQQMAAVAKRKQRAAELKRHATAVIQAAYPEHLFHLEVDENYGHVIIDHPLLAHSKARYFCRWSDYDEGRGVVKLAGEILERVNIRRGELKNYEQYDEAAGLAKTQFNAR